MIYTGNLTRDLRVRLSEAQMQKLIDASKASGMTVCEVVRQLISKL